MQVHNYSSWEKPDNVQNIAFDIPYDSDEGTESLRELLKCDQLEHAGCEAVARSFVRDTTVI